VTRLRADFLLLINAVIWGVAFVVQKKANDTIGPVTFIALRFLVSAILALPLALLERRKHPRVTSVDYAQGVIVGLVLFISMILQQVGLIHTSATNAGFLTSLYVCIVPYVAWRLLGDVPDRRHLFACALCVSGAWLLATDGARLRLNIGDIYIVASAFGFALWIVLISRFMKQSNRPFFMAATQYTATAALGLAFGPGLEAPTVAAVRESIWPILFTGVFSGAVATTLQGVAQKYTPATDAALIISLESVVAAIAGFYLLGETPGRIAMIGGVMILVAALVAEGVPLPSVLRRRGKASG
jgi:drug/metabolite transporter (DMT)-like permease